MVSTLLTEPKVMVGKAFTVPLAETVLVAPPLVVMLTVPEGVPDAAAVKRT